MADVPGVSGVDEVVGDPGGDLPLRPGAGGAGGAVGPVVAELLVGEVRGVAAVGMVVGVGAGGDAELGADEGDDGGNAGGPTVPNRPRRLLGR